MKKMLAGFTVLVIMLSLSSFMVTASNNPFGEGSLEEWDEWAGWDREEKLVGRDFVQLGELLSHTGVLMLEDGEWFIVTADSTFEIHLGDHDYREQIGLELAEGQNAVVYGYVYHDDIAVVSLSLTQPPVAYQFRHENGIPLWAGQAGMGQYRGQGRMLQLNPIGEGQQQTEGN